MATSVPVTMFFAYINGMFVDCFDAKGSRGARTHVNRFYTTPELMTICPEGGDHEAAKLESLRLQKEARQERLVQPGGLHKELISDIEAAVKTSEVAHTCEWLVSEGYASDEAHARELVNSALRVQEE